MAAVASQVVFDPDLVLTLLEARGGEYPFADLLQALQEKGLDESTSREILWHVLALGLIEFTEDRSSLRLRP